MSPIMGKTCHMIGEKHGQNMLHGIESEMMGKICHMKWERYGTCPCERILQRSWIESLC